jgi:hypothetical protein
MWTSTTGKSALLLEAAGTPIPFLDQHDNDVYWVFPYKIDNNLGKLGLFNQTTLNNELIGDNVPTDGFSVELLAQVHEPAIVLIQDAERLPDGRLRGTLRARSISGDLGSKVDDHVTSYVAVYAPLEGLVYSVEDDSRTGLWFAAL